MNYPIWELPAAGLLIAFVAVVHVFVAHFAVGGGLFLVLTERKARKENDGALLDYVRRLSRFFILLTLVFGAITGVGIWFTIGLVHPSATAALINVFVWGWAIEWTFFFVEIAAALVYYYGWDRMTAKMHMAIGWIYFGTAWASMIVINGILTYMMTPGRWLETFSFWDGFFNPTYWPALWIRSLGAIGLAGVFALFTATWLASPEVKAKVWRWATFRWIVPMAVGIPIGLVWFFSAAASAGIPVAEMFGAASARPLAILGAVFAPAASGHPVAQTALRVAFISLAMVILLSFAVAALRKTALARVATAALLLAALAAVGGAEWVREDLRKPYVIGSHMFVSGIRIPPPDGSRAATTPSDDPIRIDRLAETGILSATRFSALPAEVRTASVIPAEHEEAAGREVFRLTCSQCHTIDGYVAIRPLVTGKSVPAIEGLLDRLAVPRDIRGHDATWSTPGVVLASWRNRAMPPFSGTAAEKRALAVYLARLGGGGADQPVASGMGDAGASLFEENCAMCHGPDSDWPLLERIAGRSEAELYEEIGDLEAVSDMMPPFEGTDEERRALASWLATAAAGGAL
jgi:mono/diheme cytochrome c family protein